MIWFRRIVLFLLLAWWIIPIVILLFLPLWILILGWEEGKEICLGIVNMLLLRGEREEEDVISNSIH